MKINFSLESHKKKHSKSKKENFLIIYDYVWFLICDFHGARQKLKENVQI